VTIYKIQKGEENEQIIFIYCDDNGAQPGGFSAKCSRSTS
jgi:hypothetical protein